MADTTDHPGPAAAFRRVLWITVVAEAVCSESQRD